MTSKIKDKKNEILELVNLFVKNDIPKNFQDAILSRVKNLDDLKLRVIISEFEKVDNQRLKHEDAIKKLDDICKKMLDKINKNLDRTEAKILEEFDKTFRKE